MESKKVFFVAQLFVWDSQKIILYWTAIVILEVAAVIFPI